MVGMIPAVIVSVWRISACLASVQICGCLPEDAKGNGAVMQTKERRVTPQQLLDLEMAMLRPVGGGDPRILTDMVERLVDFCPHGPGGRPNDWTANRPDPLYFALLKAIKERIADGRLTREKLQSFLHDPLGTLSDSQMIMHIPTSGNGPRERAGHIHSRAVELGFKDELPAWFVNAFKDRRTLRALDPNLRVHRLCLGHITTHESRRMIVRKGLVPADIDILLSLAECNTYKHPHIATGTMVFHQGKLMNSPASYVPCVWYGPDGVGHLDVTELNGQTTSDSSYLAVEPSK